MHQRIGAKNPVYLDNDWVIVRNYHDFCETIKENGLPSVVSFDHDLAEIHYDPKTWTEGFEYTEETGDDCARWLIEYCKDNDEDLPVCFVHSMNPVGTENIKRTLNKTK
jgi:hypothetical protein